MQLALPSEFKSLGRESKAGARTSSVGANKFKLGT
jgi:hypothetical protein